MESQRIIETRGVIIKEENLKSLVSNILENSLVLENTDSFPGYFGENLPETNKPRSLFIVLDKKYDGLFLARTLKNISLKSKLKCYGSFGDININRKLYYCIRIKNLDCFQSVMEIQKSLMDANIGLMNFHQINSPALIRIHKSFLIREIGNGVYKDLFETDRYYISIPHELNWENFKRMSLIVKSNMDNNMFDAALGFLWRLEGLMDVIRIYDQKNDPERIKVIREKYLNEITHL